MNAAAYSKAIVAFVMAAILLLNTFFNTGIVVSEETVTTVVGLFLPVLVYLIPNRKT